MVKLEGWMQSRFAHVSDAVLQGFLQAHFFMSIPLTANELENLWESGCRDLFLDGTRRVDKHIVPKVRRTLMFDRHLWECRHLSGRFEPPIRCDLRNGRGTYRVPAVYDKHDLATKMALRLGCCCPCCDVPHRVYMVTCGEATRASQLLGGMGLIPSQYVFLPNGEELRIKVGDICDSCLPHAIQSLRKAKKSGLDERDAFMLELVRQAASGRWREFCAVRRPAA